MAPILLLLGSTPLRFFSFLAGLAFALAVPGSACAEIDLEIDVPAGRRPVLFSSGMVMQHGVVAPVFGKADPGEAVSVSFNGQTKSTITGEDGRWRVDLDPLTPGGPFEMTITGDNEIVLTDVLVGDVWVATGQSNMGIRRPDSKRMAKYPLVRAIKKSDWRDRPGGTPFDIGAQLHEHLGIPIGILNRPSRGQGAGVQAWLPKSALEDPDPNVQAILPDLGIRTSGQFEELILPFIPFAIKGVMWWQGEGDLRRAGSAQLSGPRDYRHLFPALIRAWRVEWNHPNLPFIFMQLPTGFGMKPDRTVASLPGKVPDDTRANVMRQAYVATQRDEPNTGMAQSADLDGGAHPKARETYAARLVSVARRIAYGEEFIYSGPALAGASVEGNRIRIRFKEHTATGLHAKGSTLQGFMISNDGVNFVWANAEIQGEEVVVWSDEVSAPIEARYGWNKHFTWANLFNGADLNPSTFSTDPLAPVSVTTTSTVTSTTVSTTTTTLLPICNPVPDLECHSGQAGKSSLNVDGDAPSIKFKLLRGQATDKAEFGNPIDGDTRFGVCLYDASPGPQPLFEAQVDSGGICNSRDCWAEKGRGFDYKFRTGNTTGISRLKVLGGEDRRTRIAVVGQGANLRLPAQPLELGAVTVQVVSEDGAGRRCWQVVFPDPALNTESRFNALGP